jgi:hypothetical protein
MRSPLALGLAVALVGCSGGDDRSADVEQRPPPAPVILPDAAPSPDQLPVQPRFDPSGAAVGEPPVASGGDRPVTRDRRMLALMLVSTPSGATAAVDGKVVGRTPTYWEGPFTGREREFTFVLSGYTMARYRFVPIQDGFVHGTLEHVGDGDAGVPAIPAPVEESPPPFQPVAIDAAPPPPRRPPPDAPPPSPLPPDAGVPVPDAASPPPVVPDSGP